MHAKQLYYEEGGHEDIQKDTEHQQYKGFLPYNRKLGKRGQHERKRRSRNC